MAGILFFEMMIPKFLHILDKLPDYNLEINILNDNNIIFNKAFNMTSNLKIIKFLDFDDLLHPKLDDLFTENDSSFNQKKIFFSIIFIKFQKETFISLIQYSH